MGNTQGRGDETIIEGQRFTHCSTWSPSLPPSQRKENMIRLHTRNAAHTATTEHHDRSWEQAMISGMEIERDVACVEFSDFEDEMEQAGCLVIGLDDQGDACFAPSKGPQKVGLEEVDLEEEGMDSEVFVELEFDGFEEVPQLPSKWAGVFVGFARNFRSTKVMENGIEAGRATPTEVAVFIKTFKERYQNEFAVIISFPNNKGSNGYTIRTNKAFNFVLYCPVVRILRKSDMELLHEYSDQVVVLSSDVRNTYKWDVFIMDHNREWLGSTHVLYGKLKSASKASSTRRLSMLQTIASTPPQRRRNNTE